MIFFNLIVVVGACIKTFVNTLKKKLIKKNSDRKTQKQNFTNINPSKQTWKIQFHSCFYFSSADKFDIIINCYTFLSIIICSQYASTFIPILTEKRRIFLNINLCNCNWRLHSTSSILYPTISCCAIEC